MARRRVQRRCEEHDRQCYRHEQEAMRAAVDLYNRVPGARLAVYRCESSKAWHVTTTAFWAAMVQTS